MSFHGADSAPRFDLGRVLITPGARAALKDAEVHFALIRHRSGDWGDVCKEDSVANERSLSNGDRILSVYHSSARMKFYVITEADRSVTTILLPHEY